jgi:hypothetical protein
VEVVRGDLEARIGLRQGSAGPRLDVELAPQRVDVVLAVVHLNVLHHVVAHSRVGAIGADHEVKVDLNLARPARCRLGGHDFEPGLARLEVCAGELVAEEEADVGHVFEDVEQALVEAGAVDGIDCLRWSQ